MEATLATQAAIPFAPVPFEGMPRRGKLLTHGLPWLWKLLRATLQARGHLRHFGATVVLGTGGYVAAPVLLAAKTLGIPYWVHEADAEPGLVNKLCAPHAHGVSVAFEAAAQRLKLPAGRWYHTGNPLRGSLGQVQGEEALQALGLPHWSPQAPTLVVLGGSQGAQTLNAAVVEALEALLTAHPTLQVLHQCGAKLWEANQAHYQSRYPQTPPWQPRYEARPYFEAMAPVWGLATVALCRAGSLTLSELYLAGVPAVLVPYPHAAANHQWLNAMAAQAAGAAVVLANGQCSAPALEALLAPLLAGDAVTPPHPTQGASLAEVTEGPCYALAPMRQAALALAKPHAAATIAKHLLGLVNCG
jgi:UDP-N-acetylglucosamine--N-acetylmuramyl-(pentapeptide) pyrophosphoryl-undecaprenol N-acetylglucosamine transferase